MLFPAQFASKIPHNLIFFPHPVRSPAHVNYPGFYSTKFSWKIYQFFQLEHEIPTSPGLEITGSSKKNEANISEKKFLLLLPS